MAGFFTYLLIHITWGVASLAVYEKEIESKRDYIKCFAFNSLAAPVIMTKWLIKKE